LCAGIVSAVSFTSTFCRRDKVFAPYRYDLGYFDDESCRRAPIENPFGSKVSPMSSAVRVKVVVALFKMPH